VQSDIHILRQDGLSMVGHREPRHGRVIGGHFRPRSSARIRRPA
jgi:hypothetical protein